MMLPQLDVRQEMIGEAWTYYKDTIHQIHPRACARVFTTTNLARFIDTFMSHQTPAYVFCELCNPNERIEFYFIIVILQDQTVPYGTTWRKL